MKEIVNQKDIKTLVGLDEIFVGIDALYGPPPNWFRSPGFISLAKIILEQQVSLASAKAHFNKLNDYLEDFTPAGILKLSDAEMKSCQISWQKAKYIRALSAAIIEGSLNLKELIELNNEEVRQQLTRIKGIGNWSADIYLMFCLQAKDVFPIGDIAVVNTLRELRTLKTKDEMIALAEKWRPLRSLATYYLWHYYLNKRNRL